LFSSLCALVLIGATAARPGSGPAKPAPADNEPTRITAQKMTVRNQESKAIFEGAVVLTKGALIVHSDTMVVLFKPGDQRDSGGKPFDGTQKAGRIEAAPMPGNRAVHVIEATGRVRIEKDDGTATCEKAVYYKDEEKIILTGSPVAWQKGTRVSGKVITMFLAEDRSVVEGNSNVLLEPEQAGSR
jgi:lipopolysaccharide export system protein LptA